MEQSTGLVIAAATLVEGASCQSRYLDLREAEHNVTEKNIRTKECTTHINDKERKKYENILKMYESN